MRFKAMDVIKTCAFTFAFTFAFTVVIAIVSIILATLFGQSSQLNTFFIGIISAALLFSSLYFINKYMLKKNGLRWDALGFRTLNKSQTIKLLWQIPVLWFLCMAIQIIIILIVLNMDKLPDSQGTTQSIITNGSTIPLVFFSIVVVAPLFEEIVLRGMLQEALSEKFGSLVAILIGGVFFVLIHFFLFYLAPAYLLFGLALGYLYYKYKSIYAPLGLHIFINVINFIIVALLSL